MKTCNLKGSHGGLSGVLLSKIAKTNSQGEIPVTGECQWCIICMIDHL